MYTGQLNLVATGNIASIQCSSYIAKFDPLSMRHYIHDIAVQIGGELHGLVDSLQFFIEHGE